MSAYTLTVSDQVMPQDSYLWEIQELRQSIHEPWSLRMSRSVAYDSNTPGWEEDQTVKLEGPTGILFQGKIVSTNRMLAGTNQERIGYECQDNRFASRYVAVDHKSVDGGRVVWNAPKGDVDADCVGTEKTVGEIIAEILNENRVALSGIIGDGTVGAGYGPIAGPGGLNELNEVPGKVVFAGTGVEEAITSLVQMQPRYGWYVATGTTSPPCPHELKLVDTKDETVKCVLSLGVDYLTNQDLNIGVEEVWTAAKVFGNNESTDVLTEIGALWDAALEADWTEEKAAQYPDTYGRVWRRFGSMNISNMARDRQLGSRKPFAVIEQDVEDRIIISDIGQIEEASGVTYINTSQLGRQLDAAQTGWEAPTKVSLRYSQKGSRLVGSYPTGGGYTGGGYTSRSIERKKSIVDRSKTKITYEATIEEVLSTTAFRVLWPGVSDNEMSQSTIVRATALGVTFSNTLTSHDGGIFTLSAADATMAANDTITVYVQDDTAVLSGSVFTPCEKVAYEFVVPHCDVPLSGNVELATLTSKPFIGEALIIADTNDSEYATLYPDITAVTWNFVAKATSIELQAHKREWDAALIDRSQQHSEQITNLGTSVDALETIGLSERAGHDTPMLRGDGIWTGYATAGAIAHISLGTLTGYYQADMTGSPCKIVRGVGYDAAHHAKGIWDVELKGSGSIAVDGSVWAEPLVGGVITFSHGSAASPSETQGDGADDFIAQVAWDIGGHMVSATAVSLSARAGAGLDYDAGTGFKIVAAGDDWITPTVNADSIGFVHEDVQTTSIGPFNYAAQGPSDFFCVYCRDESDDKGHVKHIASYMRKWTTVLGDGLEWSAGATSRFSVTCTAPIWIDGDDRVALSYGAGLALDGSQLVLDATGIAGSGLAWDGSVLDVDVAAPIWIDGDSRVALSYGAGLAVIGDKLEIYNAPPLYTNASDYLCLSYGDGLDVVDFTLVWDGTAQAGNGLTYTAGSMGLLVDAPLRLDNGSATGVLNLWFSDGFTLAGSELQVGVGDRIVIDPMSNAVQHGIDGNPTGTYTITCGTIIVVDCYGHILSVTNP